MLGRAVRRFGTKWAEQVKGEIEKTRVLVYSKSYCPYCSNTKKVLENMQVGAKVYELDLVSGGEGIQSALIELTKQRTFPNIFISGVHIGGNSDLMDGLKSGKIQKLFEDNQIAYKPLT